MKTAQAWRSEDEVFRALADPTRRTMLRKLSEGDACVSDLVAQADVTQSAVSQHLKILRDAGLVKERRDGRLHIYRLEPKPLLVVRDWLAQYEDFWAERFDRLGKLLRARHAKTNQV
jgi:DNA-binding transcriptional ArsR family regulator